MTSQVSIYREAEHSRTRSEHSRTQAHLSPLFKLKGKERGCSGVWVRAHRWYKPWANSGLEYHSDSSGLRRIIFLGSSSLSSG